MEQNKNKMRPTHLPAIYRATKQSHIQDLENVSVDRTIKIDIINM